MAADRDDGPRGIVPAGLSDEIDARRPPASELVVFDGYFCDTMLCRCSPTPSTLHTPTSPAFIQRGLLRSMFVPGGDPAEIMSPGFSVSTLEPYASISQMLYSMRLVLESWRISPFSVKKCRVFIGFGRNSLGTMKGPSGAK